MKYAYKLAMRVASREWEPRSRRAVGFAQAVSPSAPVERVRVRSGDRTHTLHFATVDGLDRYRCSCENFRIRGSHPNHLEGPCKHLWVARPDARPRPAWRLDDRTWDGRRWIVFRTPL